MSSGSDVELELAKLKGQLPAGSAPQAIGGAAEAPTGTTAEAAPDAQPAPEAGQS
jgi:hypothetical protein